MAESTQEIIQRLVSELEQDRLRRVHRWDPEVVVKYVAHSLQWFSYVFLKEIFSRCGLKESDCLHTFNRLLARTDHLELKGRGEYFMPRPQREEFASWLKEQLGEEPEPEKTQVSKTLQDLESQITDHEESLFYAETRRCLEAGAYRATIIMGWNLVYDHLIRWVFSDSTRLSSFNNELTARWVNKAKKTKYDAIVDIEDFGNVKESMVIDVCHKSKIITKEDFDMLDDALRKRNKFAHPKSKHIADSPIASGFVSELVRLMLHLT